MPDAPRRPPMSDPWFSRLRPVRPEDEALDQLLAEAAETLGFRSAAIVLARETTGEFEYVALHGDEDARELLHTSHGTTSWRRSRRPTSSAWCAT